MNDVSSTQIARRGQSGCLVMLTVALVLAGIFYGIFWGLQGAYLGEMSPVKSQPSPTTTPPSTSGAQP